MQYNIHLEEHAVKKGAISFFFHSFFSGFLQELINQTENKRLLDR